MQNKTQLANEIAETFTRRDLDVLTLLAQDLSDREIADRLTLALSTVKWYARQVYTKLGVSQRSEAAERARALGLLPPPAPAILPTGIHNNLPGQLTSFIGRERDISELQQRLRMKEAHLLTLTGSGGTGKTRLAIEAAKELLDFYPDGVWLVEFAPLADPLLVPQAVIAAMGLVELPDKSSITFLSEYLRE